MTGLSPKPVTNQTPHIQTNNANSDGLTGFSGKNLHNAHAREAALLPVFLHSKLQIIGIFDPFSKKNMYLCNVLYSLYKIISGQ